MDNTIEIIKSAPVPTELKNKAIEAGLIELNQNITFNELEEKINKKNLSLYIIFCFVQGFTQWGKEDYYRDAYIVEDNIRFNCDNLTYLITSSEEYKNRIDYIESNKVILKWKCSEDISNVYVTFFEKVLNIIIERKIK